MEAVGGKTGTDGDREQATTSKVPRIAVEQLVLKNGQEVRVNEGDTLLIVGPNNAGKSAFLRDLKLSVENPVNSRRVLIASAKVATYGSSGALLDWLHKRGAIRSRKRSGHQIMMAGGREFEPSNAQNWWTNIKNGLHSLTEMFLFELSTEGRLNAANPDSRNL
jgi:hypothetical protein